MSWWASRTMMNICLESVCSLCHALGCQGHSFPKHQELAQRRAVNAGGRGRLLQISCGVAIKTFWIQRTFELRGVSPTPSSASQRGASEASLLVKTWLQWEDRWHPRWSLLNCVLAVVGELGRTFYALLLPDPLLRKTPPLLASGPPFAGSLFSRMFAHPRSSGISHHCSWASWTVSLLGPRVAAEWSTLPSMPCL